MGTIKIDLFPHFSNLLLNHPEIINHSHSPLPQDQTTDHFMLREIYEQPEVLQACLSKYLNASSPDSRLPTPDSPSPTPFNLPSSFHTNLDQIHILACGTSRHAALVAQYWFEQITRISTRVRSASEFIAAPLPLTSQTGTITITQSGETADTLAAVDHQKVRYAQLNISQPQLLGITNQTDSSLATRVDSILPTLAGEEIGVAATKTFTTQLAVLSCLVLDIAYQTSAINDEQMNSIVSELRSLPEQIATVLRQQEKAIEDLARHLSKASNCIVLGQGINRAIALEGALKLKETTYLHAEGYAAGEFLHGPIALLDDTIPVIVIAPSDRTQEQVMSVIRRVKSHNGPVIGITTSATDPNTIKLFNKTIALPAVHEWLTPFLTVIPLQLLAYHVAVQKGLNVDRPRNITKTLA